MAKVAIVTGGTRGIGAAISKGLKAAGCTVAATYHGNDAAAEKFKAETGVAAYKWDVADPAASAAGVKQVEAALGPVEILVNNAGITRDNIFVRLRDEDWDQVIAVDLTAGFRLARAATRGMMRRRFGRIIGITSVVGVTGNAGQANYAAAKAGMIGMTKALAQEVASRNVTVNCIAPGFVGTAMTAVLTEKQRDAILGAVPARRLGTVEEIAAAAVFLASTEAAYVTGQTLHVNGGMAMI
jgi:3-oxoacyl-[acyl-carrier protein] reductase